MAFALKYTYTFQQLIAYTTSDWKIEIYLEGFGGGATAINNMGRNSIILSREGDFMSNVQGTQLSFDIYNETEGQYIEFATADWGDYQVRLIKDPSGSADEIFRGYNQTENQTEPHEQPPYTINLKFTCGLNHLQYIRWDDSGTLYTGQKPLIEVLRLALNKLPDGLDVREFVNVYEDSIVSTTTDSMLALIFVDSSLYKEVDHEGEETDTKAFFAHQVIQEILKVLMATIFQYDGIWYIIRWQEYKDATMFFRQFLPRVGSESTVTVDSTGSFTTNERTVTNRDEGNALELIMQSSSSEDETLRPLNRIKITYTQQNLDFENSDTIRNGCFDDITASALSTGNGFPTYWTETITGLNDSDTYFAMKSWNINNPNAGNVFQFDPTLQQPNEALNALEFITYGKLNVPIAVTDSLDFSFHSKVEIKVVADVTPPMVLNASNYVNNDMKITYEFRINFGLYTLSGDPDTGYSWVLSTVTNCKFWSIGSIGIWLGAGGTRISHFNFQEILPVFPVSGINDMTITAFMPYTDVPSYSTNDPSATVTIETLYFGCFQMIYLPDETDPIQDSILYAEILEDKQELDIDVIHGDGTTTIAQGSFRITGGAITDAWSRRGLGESKEIITIMADTFKDLRGEYIRVINGKLIGEFSMYNSISETVGAVTTSYMIDTYTYMLENNEVTVRLMELDSSAASQTLLTSFIPVKQSTTETTPLPDYPSGTGTGVGVVTPVLDVSPTIRMNTDQKELSDYN